MQGSFWLSGCGVLALMSSAASAQTIPASTARQGGAAANEAEAGTPPSPVPTNTVGVEDIVVTAQRRTERLQNVPIAVSAASAARLAATGVTSTQDLVIVTPGLSITQAAGYSQPHIRGVGSSTNGPGLEQPVATYVDGVYIASAPASLLTLNNIDRVEVLKGPQGTLFGRNSTGGLIQVVTKDPSHVLHGTFDLGYANYQDVSGDAYLTGGLTDSLSADVALRYETQGKAWGTNLGTGNGVGKLDHDFAGRSKFLFEPSSDTKIRLALDYEQRTSSRDAQHLDFQYPATFNNAFFGGPFNYGKTYDVNDNLDPIYKLKSGGISLQVNQKLGSVNLQNIVAYREAKFFFYLDTDLTPDDLLSIPGTAKDAQFSEELQFSSAGSGKLKWVAGLFYFHAKDSWDPLYINFGPSVISPVPGVPTEVGINDTQRTDSVAGYGQATYEVFKDTRLTLGGRYTYEHKSLGGTQQFSIAGTLVSTTPIPDPALGIAPSVSFKNFSYRIALDHQFGSNILGYVSYNTGFKSGGYNTDLPSNIPFRPEKIGALEAGLKTKLFDNHLRLNMSAYRYNYTDLQIGRFINGNQAIYNGARARIYGFDLDGEVVIDRKLSLTTGFSYSHARFTSFPDADFFKPVGNCVPAPGGVCSGDASGNTLPYAPETTFNVGGHYKQPVSFGVLDFDANYFRSAHFFANPDNIGFQPGYDLINLSASWTDLSSHISIKGFVKNLGKTIYATSLIEANQGLVRALGAPRTYGVTIGYKF